MRRCLACGSAFGSPGWACPACARAPADRGGFPCFAPDLAEDQSAYQGDYFPEIRDLEEGSFWFQSRNRLIEWALRSHGGPRGRFLEAGCGTGFVLSHLIRSFPGWRFSGSEASLAALRVARERLPEADLLQADARDLPFQGEFEAIGAFDVLEHIQDDRSALASMARALAPGGLLLVTVPQHPWLWSGVDVFARHARRYRRKDLAGKLEAAGLELVQATSYVSLLLPLLALSRAGGSETGRERKPELRIPPGVNRVLGWIQGAERRMIASGLRFPAGGSLLVIARKPAP